MAETKAAYASDRASGETDEATTKTFPADDGRFQTIVRRHPASQADF